jgi:hypothetical protein
MSARVSRLARLFFLSVLFAVPAACGGDGGADGIQAELEDEPIDDESNVLEQRKNAGKVVLIPDSR